MRIDDVHAELLPADKVRVIGELVGRYGVLGDGINDTPAMARASFAVAMGAAGSDAARGQEWVLDHARSARTVELVKASRAAPVAVV